jgi:hypothetical protein
LTLTLSLDQHGLLSSTCMRMKSTNGFPSMAQYFSG